MLWNSLLKKPILATGILLFIVFLIQLNQNGKFSIFNNPKLRPTSCQAVLVKLKKHTPGGWDVFCEHGNNVAVEMSENPEIEDLRKMRAYLYRQMANHLQFIVKNSPLDSLERVNIVRLKIESAKISINAITSGAMIIKLAHIQSPEYIATHLQQTVKVQEVLK